MLQPEQRRILATSIPGPKSQKLQAQRVAELSGGLGITMPVFIERAGGGILVDVDGNQIIDFASGIAVTSVGASEPAVVRRIAEQAERFTHTCFLVTEYEGVVAVAAALNRLTPGDHPKRTALFTTGAEAVENAIKIARTATGRPAAIVLGHAYHGRTLLTMTMTAKNVPYKQGFGPFAPEVYRAPSPYPYRWPSGPENCAEEALAALRDIVITEVGANNVAAIVAEGRLGALTGADSVVGEVRGRGAMLAVEFVEPGTREPAPDTARQVASQCHSEGLLILVCGTSGNVIRLLPPLVISQELLSDGLDVLERAIKAAS